MDILVLIMITSIKLIYSFALKIDQCLSLMYITCNYLRERLKMLGFRKE